jgi:hypothetical protein
VQDAYRVAVQRGFGAGESSGRFGGWRTAAVSLGRFDGRSRGRGGPLPPPYPPPSPRCAVGGSLFYRIASFGVNEIFAGQPLPERGRTDGPSRQEGAPRRPKRTRARLAMCR